MVVDRGTEHSFVHIDVLDVPAVRNGDDNILAKIVPYEHGLDQNKGPCNLEAIGYILRCKKGLNFVKETKRSSFSTFGILPVNI